MTTPQPRADVCDHQWTDYGSLQSGNRPRIEIEACVRCGVQRKKAASMNTDKRRGYKPEISRRMKAMWADRRRKLAMRADAPPYAKLNEIQHTPIPAYDRDKDHLIAALRIAVEESDKVKRHLAMGGRVDYAIQRLSLMRKRIAKALEGK